MKSIYAGSGMPPFIAAVAAKEKEFWQAKQGVLRVLAVDPGKITGVAVLWFRPEDGEIVGWGETMLAHDENKQADDLLELLRVLGDFGRVWTVVETFIVDQVNMSPDFLSPVRIGRSFAFGAHLLAAGRLDGQPVLGCVEMPVAWNSRARKADFQDPRLKKLGFYTPGPDHRRDATRHALVRWKQLKLELPRSVGTSTKYWEPGMENTQLRIQRSFNGVPVTTRGKRAVTKEDMQRIKLTPPALNSSGPSEWEVMAEKMIHLAKHGAVVGITGENLKMPEKLQRYVEESTGMRWMPAPKGIGFVLEHDPRTQSGVLPAPPERLKMIDERDSSKASKQPAKRKKRVLRRLA